MAEFADSSLGRPAAIALSPVAVQAVQAPGCEADFSVVDLVFEGTAFLAHIWPTHLNVFSGSVSY